MPRNWKEVIWVITWLNKFQPDKIWNMYLDELLFWDEGANYILKMIFKFLGIESGSDSE